MNWKWVVLICLISLCAEGKSLSMTENIEIEGDGQMKSLTDIPCARDAIDAGGQYQNYTRSFSFDEEVVSFKSDYTLNNNLGYESSYAIAMIGNDEKLQHKAKINGTSDIFSNSSITMSPQAGEDSYNDIGGNYELSTLFNLIGQGELNEAVINLNFKNHPEYLVNTWAKGAKLSIVSGLSEGVIGSSEYDKYISKLPSTKKKEYIENETPKFEGNDDKAVNVKEASENMVKETEEPAEEGEEETEEVGPK